MRNGSRTRLQGVDECSARYEIPKLSARQIFAEDLSHLKDRSCFIALSLPKNFWYSDGTQGSFEYHHHHIPTPNLAADLSPVSEHSDEPCGAVCGN